MADRIGVTVKDGRATLTGDVDTWSEYREAARVAFHMEGVRGLDNRLALGGKPHHWEEWK